MKPRQKVYCPGGTVHTIVKGDTYYKLAQRYNTTVDAIRRANPGVNENNLQIGHQLCIPASPQPAPCPGGTTHTIVSGDTYYRLAQRYNTTVDAIRRANPGVDENNLQIGQKICIPVSPGPGPAPGPYIGCCVHTIRARDTFSKLAQRYNTSSKAIEDQNWCLDPNNLQIGQQICIPLPYSNPGCVYHTVVKNDTFYKLAQHYHTTVNAIHRANPCADEYNLQIGEKLCIPRY